MNLIFYTIILFLNVFKSGVTSTVSRSDYGEIKLFKSPESYSVESTILLNDIRKKDKEVSYKLKATLNVQSSWRSKNSDTEYLLRFDLKAPQLLSRGLHVNADYLPLSSIWDSYPHTEFYAHLKDGIISEAFFGEEPVDILNFKRSLVSLFQFNVFDGEGNETDVSGTCEVTYESMSLDVIRKIKRQCSWGASEGDTEELASRRVTRYTLTQGLGALEEIHAEEIHEWGGSLGHAALKARAWLRLRRDAAAEPSQQRLADGQLSDAVKQLPATLTPQPLAMHLPADDVLEKLSTVQLSALLQREGEAVAGTGAGEGGTARAADAATRLLAGLRAAPRASLVELLHERHHPDQMTGLCRLYGLAGTLAAHQAAEQFLRLRHEDASLSLAYHYLEGLTLAPKPEEAVVTEVLRWEELPHARVVERALLAAGAGAARLPPRSPVPAAVLDALKRSLARCKDSECRVIRLHALGNLRRGDAADLLLEHAERPGAAAALAALDALDALPESALAAPARLRRLERVARAPRALTVRAAAVDILLRRCARRPLALLPLLTALHEHSPVELRRILWQRLHALAADYEPVRNMLPALPLRMRGWHARAMGGTSSLLVRHAGDGEGWSAALQSLQVARGGMLQRGRVSLMTLTPTGTSDETLTVELWARGLETLAGVDEDAATKIDEQVQPDDIDEGLAGGLALTVGGARLGGVTLFASQGELLGHVWAGTGSEATPVLRALRPLPEASVTLPLLGASALHLRWRGTVALAMDAHATVSLWGRSSRSGLQLRGALAAGADARVSGAWGDLQATSSVTLEPQLNIGADLDFYAAPALCVRASLAPYERAYNVSLSSRLGSAARTVKRSRAARHPVAGRTLALGAPNDAMCRTLTAVAA